MARPSEEESGFFVERDYPKPENWQGSDNDFEVLRITQSRKVPPGIEHA